MNKPTSKPTPDFSKVAWDQDVPLPEPRSNRKIRFVHRVEAYIMNALMGMFGAMSVDKASDRLGKFLQFLGPMIRSAHKKGHANLQLVYPEMTKAERSEILKDAWYSLGAVTAEYAHLDKLAARTTIINPEKLAPFKRTGPQHAIFFSGHFANWEAIGTAFHANDVPFAVIYRAANNPIIDADVIQRRGAVMSRWQIPKGRRGAKDILYALKHGVSICIMADQKFNDGISVPFLGHQAMTATAAARLALRENVPLVPVHIIRRPGAHFDLVIYDPLDLTKTGNTTKDIENACIQMNEAVGAMVLEQPGQWLWFHRRWPKRVTG